MTDNPPRTSSRLLLRIDRREIAFLKFILEAYDGVALMRTIDPQSGTVELLIGPGCEGEVARILEDLGSRIRIEVSTDAVSGPPDRPLQGCPVGSAEENGT